MVTKKLFGTTKDGKAVYSFTVKEGDAEFEAISYGGAVRTLIVPDKNGKKVDVLLGYNTLKEYEEGTAYFGAIIGRTANRIGKGKFVLDGKEYLAPINNGPNCNHGGDDFNTAIWEGEEIENGVLFTYTSKDGKNGYPANLKMAVKYTLCGGVFTIEYLGEADGKTLLAPTWHGYFNLNGEGKGDAMENALLIQADEFISSDENLLPTGEIRKVEGTAFDFRQEKTLKKDINENDIDLIHGRGYDHCFLLKTGENAIVAYSPETGIELKVTTDQKAAQLYTGNWVDCQGKSGYYGLKSGYALETGMVTNNVNILAFQKYGCAILEKGQLFHAKTSYSFGVRK